MARSATAKVRRAIAARCVATGTRSSAAPSPESTRVRPVRSQPGGGKPTARSTATVLVITSTATRRVTAGPAGSVRTTARIRRGVVDAPTGTATTAKPGALRFATVSATNRSRPWAGSRVESCRAIRQLWSWATAHRRLQWTTPRRITISRGLRRDAERQAEVHRLMAG